jgi:ligand-binding SRPBCC domain-containing protein
VKVYEFTAEQWVPRPIEEVFEFFTDAGNLEDITPPWLKFEIVTPRPIEMRAGALIDYKLRFHGVPMKWCTEITTWDPPHSFQDIQLRGPYSLWRHTHTFEAENGGTRLRDRVEYAIPFGVLGQLVHAISVRENVRSIFAYRNTRIREHFGA